MEVGDWKCFKCVIFLGHQKIKNLTWEGRNSQRGGRGGACKSINMQIYAN